MNMIVLGDRTIVPLVRHVCAINRKNKNNNKNKETVKSDHPLDKTLPSPPPSSSSLPPSSTSSTTTSSPSLPLTDAWGVWLNHHENEDEDEEALVAEVKRIAQSEFSAMFWNEYNEVRSFYDVVILAK